MGSSRKTVGDRSTTEGKEWVGNGWGRIFFGGEINISRRWREDYPMLLLCVLLLLLLHLAFDWAEGQGQGCSRRPGYILKWEALRPSAALGHRHCRLSRVSPAK